MERTYVLGMGYEESVGDALTFALISVTIVGMTGNTFWDIGIVIQISAVLAFQVLSIHI